MSYIRWTKRYDLRVNNKHFKVFISEDDANQFHAGCLWYEGERALKARGQKGGLRFALETRVDTSEKAALGQLLQWVTGKFGSGYDLSPEK